MVSGLDIEYSLMREGLDFETIAADLDRDGFAIIDFPEPELDRLAKEMWESLQPHWNWEPWRANIVADVRVCDAWSFNDNVRRLASNPIMARLLSELYGRRAIPFQTLNFPVGTQQNVHSDIVHFCARPAHFMCGVWVALEDVREGAGPLFYYPGSHKWPIIYPEDAGAPQAPVDTPYIHYHNLDKAWSNEIEKRKAKPFRFLAKKGQALIWAANLLHGGTPQTDRSLTRHSQVTHYFFEGCTYYTPLTGMVRQPVEIEPLPSTAGRTS